MTIRQAAILVGGLGTRLGALTAETPKPLLRCGDRPFLAWVLRELCRYGIEETLLLTGYLAGTVDRALPGLAAELPRPMRLLCLAEPTPAGTGGALFHARAHLAERFLLLNGDSWLDTPLGPLLAADDPAPVIGRMLLRPVPDAARYGIVDTDGERVVAFREKDGRAGPASINAGIYRLDRRVLDRVSASCSLERDVMPALAMDGALRATVAGGYFIDIGVPDDLEGAQTELPARLRRRALFLDRDGVINHNHGYVGTQDRFDFMDGALEAIAAATRAGWHVFVVTNQSGIARGLYDEAAFDTLMRWLSDRVLAAGGTIDDMRYCPYHPDATVDAYRRDSDWRKPAPGMILDLLTRWELDPAQCVLVGDQLSDLAAACAAGVPGVLFHGGDLRDTVLPLLASPRPHSPP